MFECMYVSLSLFHICVFVCLCVYVMLIGAHRKGKHWHGNEVVFSCSCHLEKQKTCLATDTAKSVKKRHMNDTPDSSMSDL